MRGSRSRFRGFARPAAVLKSTFSPSQSIQTIVSCGEPSGLTVPTVAKFGSSRSCACSSVSAAKLAFDAGRVDRLRRDLHLDPAFVRLSPGVLVLADVLLGQAVDLVVGVVFRELGPTGDRDPAIDVFGVDDGHCHAWIDSQMPLLCAPD